MIGHVYLIRNLLNGKGYVGQTASGVLLRFEQHKTAARNGVDFVLYQAMRKYGIANFTVRELSSCEIGASLNQLEQHYIELFGTFYGDGQGYNMTLGGSNGRRGFRMSDETKLKIAASLRGRKRGPMPEKVKIALSAAKVGYATSDETRAKLSAALVGNTRTLGRKHSPETREQMSKSRKGRSIATKGRPWSEARRAAQLQRFKGAI